MAILVELNEEDLEEGKPYSVDACPIALAASRTLHYRCQVYYNMIMGRAKAWLLIDLGDGRYKIVTLETAIAKWAEYFDSTQTGRLFSFYVDMKGTE